jgi:hypothetical protein
MALAKVTGMLPTDISYEPFGHSGSAKEFVRARREKITIS